MFMCSIITTGNLNLNVSWKVAGSLRMVAMEITQNMFLGTGYHTFTNSNLRGNSKEVSKLKNL